jgi:hypothetical protein
VTFAVDVVVPDIGDGRPWQLKVNLPDAPGNFTLCASRDGL